MRLLLPVLAVLVLAGCLAPAAQARKVRTCPTKDVTVLAEGRRAVVLEKGDAVWGCLRATNKGFVLAYPDVFDGSPSVKVRGHHVSTTERICGHYEGEGCFATDLKIWDLRRAKRTLFRMFQDGAGDDVSAEIDALALGPDGGALSVLHVGANRELWLFCPERSTRFQASSDVAPRLERDGRYVWALSLASGDRTLGLEPRCTRVPR